MAPCHPRCLLQGQSRSTQCSPRKPYGIIAGAESLQPMKPRTPEHQKATRWLLAGEFSFPMGCATASSSRVPCLFCTVLPLAPVLYTLLLARSSVWILGLGLGSWVGLIGPLVAQKLGRVALTRDDMGMAWHGPRGTGCQGCGALCGLLFLGVGSVPGGGGLCSWLRLWCRAQLRVRCGSRRLMGVRVRRGCIPGRARWRRWVWLL